MIRQDHTMEPGSHWYEAWWDPGEKRVRLKRYTALDSYSRGAFTPFNEDQTEGGPFWLVQRFRTEEVGCFDVTQVATGRREERAVRTSRLPYVALTAADAIAELEEQMRESIVLAHEAWRMAERDRGDALRWVAEHSAAVGLRDAG